jgi:hypothetical protein
MNTSPSPTAASASFSRFDTATIEDALLRGKIYAASIGETFMGMSIDIDIHGFVEIHIAGIDTVRL